MTDWEPYAPPGSHGGGNDLPAPNPADAALAAIILASPPVIGEATPNDAVFTSIALTDVVAPNLFLASPANAPGPPALRAVAESDFAGISLSASAALASGSTTPRTLAAWFGDVANVKAFGAKGNGVTNDTAAIQAAVTAVGNAGGGRVFFPPGIYVVAATIMVQSNTLIEGCGSATTIKCSASFSGTPGNYQMFQNNGFPVGGGVPPATPNLNSEIHFKRMSFDYSLLIVAPSGGNHAIRMVGVNRVSVSYCNFNYGNDGTAFVACDDTLVFGCRAINTDNGAYDHWAGPKNARVIDSYANCAGGSAVLFNSGDGPNFIARTASGFIVSGCDFINGGISVEPLGTNINISQDIKIIGNSLTGNNAFVIGRGGITNTKIIGNTFNGTNAVPAIWIDQHSNGNFPSDTTIIGNTISGVTTASANLGAIRLYGDCKISSNTVSGSYPYAVYLGGGTTSAFGSGNEFAPGSSGTVAGIILENTDAVLPNGGHGFAQQDASGNLVRWVVQSDNNVVFYSTDASGGSRTIFSFSAENSTSPLAFGVPISVQGGGIITGGVGAPTNSTVGASYKGSLYSRTDGAAGSTLYVSQGSGAWAAVAGV